MPKDLVLARFRDAVPGRRMAPGEPAALGEQSLRGDDDLNPDMRADMEGRKLIQAAVLVPLVDRPEGLTVLLTRRTDHLHDHAGQISFPGGRIDPEDADAVAAALRETEEETGLPRAHIDLIGQLDIYVTRTGFEVTPVVGLVRPGFSLNPDTFEVAEVFEVPLAFFLAPDNRRMESRVWQGRTRYFYVYPYGDYYIWGATAGMLNNLAEILGDNDSAAA
ncbi:CoA pyrophosphatase [Dongia sp.]|uniref:CoA pyrophosphatase n=1 Tax=Dongia sp. TaxID=1977262 RepID=UPI0035AF7084